MWLEAEMQKLLVRSAGVILGITGLAKSFSAIGTARALNAADPLIGIPFRQLFLLVGLVELLIAFFCLFTDKRRLSLLAVTWISTNFLVYRVGLWFIGWHRPCGCMGSLTDMLHLSPQAADNIMKGVLAYLLVGSYAMLLSQWGRERRVQSAVTRVPVTLT
ncbi:MAG: MauE/DoxX family redox-associated membrane protein [Limisphaerales bacterium]